MTESSFDKIKRLIKIIGGKAIIVEDGKPLAVMIDIDEYFNFKDTKDNISVRSSEKKQIDKANVEVNVWQRKQEERRLKQVEDNIKIDKDIYRKEKDEKDEKDDDEIVIERL